MAHRRITHNDDGSVTLETTVGMKGPHHPRRAVILTARRSAEAQGDTVQNIQLVGYDPANDDWIVRMRIATTNPNRFKVTAAAGA